MELSFERWEGMQRQGQDIADRFTSLAQGLGCMLHSQIRSTSGCSSSQVEDPRPGSQSDIGLSSWSWPWPNSRSTGRHSQVERVGFDIHRKVISSQSSRRAVVTENASGFYEIGQKLGQAGAELGACVSDFVGNVTKHFYKPGHGDGPVISAESITNNLQAPATNIGIGGTALEWRDVEESPNEGVLWQAQNTRQRRSDEGPSNQDIVSDFHDASNEELLSFLSKAQGQFQKQSSINVTTTYDSRTQDIESNIIARGDLWRAEASHGGTSSGNGNSPLFLLQIGPILFVRDTTLLLPIHLSKQHLLWYGFDRKNGVHSLCPAVWSKHRRWLLMSMICLNPLTCSFMDLQFPNGQLTYVAGEGLTGSAFLPAFGGLLQAQGRLPGESKLSFSCKNKWGTRINPSLQLPEKSLSLCLTQPLAWQRSGLMLRPTIQLSVTPIFGGRNAGWKAEFVHSPKEKLSWACGCALTIEPSAFASVSIGRSKRNGENIGSSGIVLQVESPLENFRRTTFSIQLNSGVEF